MIYHSPTGLDECTLVESMSWTDPDEPDEPERLLLLISHYRLGVRMDRQCIVYAYVGLSDDVACSDYMQQSAR